MIENVFPINFYLKDHSLPDNFSDDLRKEVNFLKRAGLWIDDDESRLKTQTFIHLESMLTLSKLHDLFLEGFHELCLSYGHDNINSIKYKMETSDVRLFSLKKGDFMSYHTHSNSTAYGIFYLDDFDNSSGGILNLVDPISSPMREYRPKIKKQIETKKHRMIIAPSFIGHEVTPIVEGEREQFVIDLKIPVLEGQDSWY